MHQAEDGSSRMNLFSSDSGGRIGFGTLQLHTGVGEPQLRSSFDESVDLLRYGYSCGYRVFDTAAAYGAGLGEELLAAAFPTALPDLVIATKGGQLRHPDGAWIIDARPSALFEACRDSLRRLRLSSISLYQLHAVDPSVPLAESVGAMLQLQSEGLIEHIGICNVSPLQVDEVAGLGRFVSVQNYFNLLYPPSDALLAATRSADAALVSWFPLESGRLATMTGTFARLAASVGITSAQLALVSLLAIAPHIAVLPGTSSRNHALENHSLPEIGEPAIGDVISSANRVAARMRTLRGKI